MWRAGIVDPVAVLRKALEIAVSGAAMTLVSDVLVHKREPLAVAKP
jgi:chaperonin GroEL (HSP60 family)